ncbi:C40 family peptidase [Gemmatimonas groenlandica]|uniref:C40 family peptidase n=1 Tax=Gemmatimonas groenlandica TaxID=2732249 RepID=A0A6M4ITL4_9BACT|nr:SH3 domain-containing C40 family peptidase [Gemmatimonas groenlandica]QJR36162.1 C40 family peptidase [Gemmatimonas groenlandica]
MGTALTLSTADRFTVRSAIAPLLGDARISASLTSQLLAGEVLQLVDGRGDWLHVRGADDYEGWTHVGYLMPFTGTEATWRISLGCVTLDAEGQRRALPLGARVAPGHEVAEGMAIDPATRATQFPRDRDAIVRSALTLFTGASYLWGGVTPWGVDCSGFVQRIFALHGVPLRRDAWQQAEDTVLVSDDVTAAHAPGDLLFFSDRDDKRITHVGIGTGNGGMIHSSLARGGIYAEGELTARLKEQGMGVRRAL